MNSNSFIRVQIRVQKNYFSSSGSAKQRSLFEFAASVDGDATALFCRKSLRAEKMAAWPLDALDLP